MAFFILFFFIFLLTNTCLYLRIVVISDEFVRCLSFRKEDDSLVSGTSSRSVMVFFFFTVLLDKYVFLSMHSCNF